MMFSLKTNFSKKKEASPSPPPRDTVNSSYESLVRSQSPPSVYDTASVTQRTTMSSPTSFDSPPPPPRRTRQDNFSHLDPVLRSSTSSLCLSCAIDSPCPLRTRCPNLIRRHLKACNSPNNGDISPQSLQSSQARLVSYYVAQDEYCQATTVSEMRNAKLQRAESEVNWFESRQLNSRLLSPNTAQKKGRAEMKMQLAKEELERAVNEQRGRAQELFDLGRF